MGYAETIAECCRYIDRNFQKELSAIELAEKYHYSYYHFCRIFQVIKDISVAEYIRCRRMEAAIDRNGESGDCDAGSGGTQLGIGSESAHNYCNVKHLCFLTF